MIVGKVKNINSKIIFIPNRESKMCEKIKDVIA